MHDLIKKLNEFTALSRERELTPSEQEERAKTRQEYLKVFKSNFESHLKTIKIVDDEGNDVTPEKLKALKEGRVEDDK